MSHLGTLLNEDSGSVEPQGLRIHIHDNLKRTPVCCFMDHTSCSDGTSACCLYVFSIKLVDLTSPLQFSGGDSGCGFAVVEETGGPQLVIFMGGDYCGLVIIRMFISLGQIILAADTIYKQIWQKMCVSQHSAAVTKCLRKST